MCTWCKNKKVFAGESVTWEWYSSKINKHFELFDTPFKNPDGSISKFEIFHDITERKQSEEALQKSEEKFRTIFENAPVLIDAFNENGKCILWNSECEKTFGWTIEDINKSADPLSLFYPEEEVRAEVLKTVVSEPNKKFREWNSHTKDGKILSVLWANFSISDNLVINLGHDITERKQAEEALQKTEEHLQQTQKMESIGTLAGGIAHDFNNILYPIIGYTEMLLEDVPEDSPFIEGLSEISTAALRAKNLVKQILTFSRQEGGELKLMKTQPIIKEALKLIRSTISTTIEIKQYIRNDCGIIKADPTQIHQIVMNLATNAYHAMQDTGGVLKVSLKEIELGELDLINPDMTPGVYACLTVADTGQGMDKNLTEKIFNPFFTTKEKGKGTGMGLSVVHGIVTGMKGVIKVYSEPGQGTEFNVYLPVVQSLSEKQEIHQAKEPIQGGIERILLVDDEEAIIGMEKSMLERLGYRVTSRTSSVEALEAFRAAPDKFDLVITDMSMPNMPGDKLAIELTKIRSDIPILLCTGFSEAMSEEKATSLGIKGFLLKPIVVKDLSHKIREVLDK